MARTKHNLDLILRVDESATKNNANEEGAIRRER